MSTHQSESTIEDPDYTLNKLKDVKLPRYLLARTNGTYEFFNKPVGMDELKFLYNLIDCDRVEGCPTSVYFEKYDVWIDEEGFMSHKPTNLMLNPFTPSTWLGMMASLGGPFGNAVIVAPGKQKHSAKKLREGFKACVNKTIEEEDLKNYISKLDAAILTVCWAG